MPMVLSPLRGLLNFLLVPTAYPVGYILPPLRNSNFNNEGITRYPDS